MYKFSIKTHQIHVVSDFTDKRVEIAVNLQGVKQSDSWPAATLKGEENQNYETESPLGVGRKEKQAKQIIGVKLNSQMNK